MLLSGCGHKSFLARRPCLLDFGHLTPHAYREWDPLVQEAVARRARQARLRTVGAPWATWRDRVQREPLRPPTHQITPLPEDIAVAPTAVEFPFPEPPMPGPGGNPPATYEGGAGG